MPVVSTEWPEGSGEWLALAVGRDGAQGPPGPASPHEGSHIAVSVRQYGAVGDGVADDTQAVQDAIWAAGSYGFVDFEAGTYRVTSGLSSWLNVRKTGPGVITDGSLEQYISPRYDGDLVILHVDGDNGSDLSDGMFPHSAFKSLVRLNEAFEKMDQEQVQRGKLIIRLSGTISGGARFRDLPVAKSFIKFEGAAPEANGRPTTWIESSGNGERFGFRFEEGQNQRVHLTNLGSRGFNEGGGAGWIMKSGGFIRTEDCWTEDCQIGSIYTGNVGFSEQRSVHRDYRTSGVRAQYNSSGSWLECQLLGGPNATEGFHVSRQSVAHVDKSLSENHNRNGAWSDMSTRVAYAGSTFRSNGWNGIRGEGSSDVHIDDQTYGVNTFGTGAEANGIKDVSIMGTSRLATTEGIYAIPEHLVDYHFGDYTTPITSNRGIEPYRVGRDSRIRIKVWGTDGSGNSLGLSLGSQDVRTVSLDSDAWVVELTAHHRNGAWQILSTLNGAGPTIQTLGEVREEVLPKVTPNGCTIKGVEFYTGG